jgi:3-deoxy-D-manno-octulosonic-acid transferase
MNLLDLAYIPVAFITAPWWIGKKRTGWRERFGHTVRLPAVKSGLKGRVLLHAVSVGEVNALRHLVPLLCTQAEVVISVTTDTGIARAKELFASSATIVRYPLDFSRSVHRFLDAIRPDVIALVELEIWPNFVSHARSRNIPVCVINGRLSARSFKGYSRFKRFFRRYYAQLSCVHAQDATYGERFVAMGVDPSKCHISGSMKWDAAKIEDSVSGADRLALELGIDRTRPLVVAGSTGPLDQDGAPIGFDGANGRALWCEEALLHAAMPAGVQLLCAPRKPERFEEAARALPGCIRRSDHPKGSAPREVNGDRFLLDTIGELRAAYALADVVVVGRSFGGLYGSDPVEPISLGKPTIIGPSHGDFQFAVDSLASGGGILVRSADQLRESIESLLRASDARENLRNSGREVIRRNQGASSRYARAVLDMISGTSIP